MTNLANKKISNTHDLFQSFQSLTTEQLNHCPMPESWSILQNVEHVFLVDVGIAKILAMPASADADSQATERYGDQKLNTMLTNRGYKVSAPDFVSPKGRLKTADEARQNINIIIDKITDHLKRHPIEHETQTFKHQFLGEMTKTDWVHFLIHHTSRHILQIEEIKKNL